MEITDLVHASTPWLTILVVIPALAAALVGLVPALRRRGRTIALGVSLVELVLAVLAATTFDWTDAGTYQLVETARWIPQIGVSWALGVNALGLVMVLLATALVPLVLLAGSREDEGGSEGGSYAALVLLLEAFMVMIFAAFDVVVFYIAFEAMLIPLYFMIGRFGVGDAERRRAAAWKFLIYSLVGGLAMLGGLVALWALVPERSETLFRLDTASQVVPGLSSGVQMGIFVSFMIAFAIKAPMVPVHTWLPDTAAASRPGTSVLLVGVLDKIGTFGMIALCLRLLPDAASQARWVLCGLAVLSILWGGLAAIGQKDLMRLVSYTSVSHFGFMVLGVFAMTTQSMTGTIFYMLNHGFGTAALFLVLGFLISRRGAQTWDAFGGVQKVAPVLAGSLLLAGLAGLGLPGMASFWGEFMVTSGTWQRYPIHAAIAILGVVLAAVYILLMYQRTMTGPVTDQVAEHVRDDLSGREKLVVAPVIALLLVFGFFPKPMVDVIEPTVKDTMTQIGVADPEPKLGR